MSSLITGLRILDDYITSVCSARDGVVIVQTNSSRDWEKRVSPQDAIKLEHLGWIFDSYDGWKYIFSRQD